MDYGMASMVSSRADFNRLHHMLHMVQISFLLTDLEAAIQFKVPREKMKEAPSPSTHSEARLFVKVGSGGLVLKEARTQSSVLSLLPSRDSSRSK